MMEEVRQLVQEEGREARNLIAFHVAVDNPGRIVRKPPRAGSNVRRAIPRVPAPRHRSASAGRDKRSELRARYWALLFGDLQRSIGEIYNTVETHENLSECQEVILVLENYTRDFKALGEWFRLKWEYDNTPPPQRPQSLAWEIRKTDFVRPESRIAPSTSPSLSGKNSPCLSGHNTPSGKNSPSLMSGKVSPGSGKLSPRISSSTSPKGTVEFFSNKINGKVTAVPEPRLVKEASRLSDIKERNSVDETVESNGDAYDANETQENKVDKVNVMVEIGTAKEIPNEAPKPVIVQTSGKPIKMLEVSKIEEGLRQEAKNQQLSKGPKGQRNIDRKKQTHEKNISSQAQATITKLDKMETEFLEKHLVDSQAKNDNVVNDDKAKEVTKKDDDKTTPTNEGSKIVAVAEVHKEPDKQEKNNKQMNRIESSDKKDNEEKKSEPKSINKIITIQDSEITVEKCEPKKTDTKSVVIKTPYSQAAAKPKITKEAKKEAPRTAAPIARSKTATDIRTNANVKQFPRKNQTNKCSYPFNLTTGRTLFENNAKVLRKPVPRNTQMSSGDNLRKTVHKRPVTLKIDEKKVDIKVQLEKVKDNEEYGSSDTVIDMTRIESSDSLKTLVADDNYNSVEVLNLDKNDNEGWLTVKSKRFGRESKKQKSHWANRFNQPSATTSLPTLNMLESPKEENINILNKVKPKEEAPKTEPPKEQKINEKVENTTAFLRQKSDVTGLRTRPTRNKMALKKADKVKDSTSEEDSPELKKNRLHSSLESLSTALSRSQENTEQAFDFDKWREYYKSIKYLQDEEITNHNEILECADPNEKNEIQEMTSQIEENERKIGLALDFQNDVDQQKLCEEEDSLNRQILELQQVSDIDLGTETDDTETDAEILNEEPSMGPSVSPILESLGPLAASLEDRYEPALAGLSWAERIDTLATLEALVARYPGRAQQLHAKLSQGMRRRGSLQETLKRYQAKQDRAEKQRLILQSERTKKIQQLLARVEEVKVAKEQLIEEKRARMDKRLQKAAQNRDQHLKDIVRKAHDEEEKLKEIAFIKQLEAEHRRHDFLLQCSTHTARLRELRRDRLNKLEQKAVREAAVVSRRSALEAARLAHVSAIQQRRRERDQRCEERKELLKQERDDAAREKAEGVKSRLEALAAAAELETDALRSRIQHKQDATRERLDKHLQAIRTKANTGRAQNTFESQEASKESPEEDENKLFEKMKACKKRTKRLEQKLMVLGEAFEDNNTPPINFSLLQPDCNKVCKILCNLHNTVQPFLRQIPVKLDVEEMGEKDLKENGECNNEVKDEKTNVNGEIKTDVGKENESDGKKKKKKKNNSECSNTEKVEMKIEVETEQKKGKNKKKNKEIDEIDQILFGLEIEERTGKKGSKKKNNKKSNRKFSDISEFEVEGKKVNNNHLVDVGYIERTLSELQRMTEKNGKNLDYHSFLRDDPIHSHQRIQGIRTMNFLLASAVDDSHVIGQLSLRTITTVVVMLSRMVTGCNMGSAYFLGTNGCLNLIKLLIKELESEVFTDQNINLIMQIADCLSVTFDSVLVVTRVEEQEVIDGNEPTADDSAFVWEVRSRAHNMICYMCSGDAINRMERAGYAKEGIHTLLTMCANLCRPCVFDLPQYAKLNKEAKYSPLRQMACHSLRMCLGHGLGGARAEFCALFDGGAGLTDPGGVFVRAARTTRLLRALAEVDYKIIQDAFSEGRWPLEFQASVSRLLAQHAPTDREDPRKKKHYLLPERLDRKLSETMVLDLIALIGYFVIDNPEHKSLFVEETRYGCLTALKSLCSLPASWIMSPPHNRTLMPTLLALYDHTSATSFIAKELNCEMLEEYIKKPEASRNRLVQLIIEHRQKKDVKKN